MGRVVLEGARQSERKTARENRTQNIELINEDAKQMSKMDEQTDEAKALDRRYVYGQGLEEGFMPSAKSKKKTVKDGKNNGK